MRRSGQLGKCRGLMRAALFGCLIFVTHSVFAASTGADNGTSTNKAETHSKFFDDQDGWLDASKFLDEAYGFVPLVAPITEPAIGYGAGGGLVFIGHMEQKEGEPYRKPGLTMVGGMATENGTWSGFGGYSDSWLDGRIETLVAAAYGSVNLDFYGIGNNSALQKNPIGYNLQPFGGLAEVHYRIGDSRLFAGLGYSFARTDVSFDTGVPPPQVSPRELESSIAGLTPSLIYDTRDNIFTPNKGMYGRVDMGVFRQAFGGSFDYERLNLTGLFYHPLSRTIKLGLKVEGKFSFDEVPFYARPFISLRGVAVRRYVGEHVMDTELEARWQFWRRFSLVGFVGAGVAWNNFEKFQSEQAVVTGGTGFRYELARKHGLHMGVDVGFGPNSPAIYIEFGNAWFRP